MLTEINKNLKAISNKVINHVQNSNYGLVEMIKYLEEVEKKYNFSVLSLSGFVSVCTNQIDEVMEKATTTASKQKLMFCKTCLETILNERMEQQQNQSLFVTK
jgi:hypothetical protein